MWSEHTILNILGSVAVIVVLLIIHFEDTD